jgi:hypothetical protein
MQSEAKEAKGKKARKKYKNSTVRGVDEQVSLAYYFKTKPQNNALMTSTPQDDVVPQIPVEIKPMETKPMVVCPESDKLNDPILSEGMVKSKVPIVTSDNPIMAAKRTKSRNVSEASYGPKESEKSKSTENALSHTSHNPLKRRRILPTPVFEEGAYPFAKKLGPNEHGFALDQVATKNRIKCQK